MPPHRWIQVALAAAVCAILAVPLVGGGRPRVVAFASPIPRPEGASDPDPEVAAFLGLLTPDDVARGAWDLATTTGAPAPDATQAAALSVPLSTARDLHARLATLRAERRRLRDRVLRDAAAVVRLLPEDAP